MKTGPAFNPAKFLPGVVLAVWAMLPTMAADLNSLPPPASVEVDYNRDIRPIFEASCFRCHGPEKPKSQFRLDNQEAALKGGAVNTNDIIPFQSALSPIIQYVAGLDEEMKMPPAGKGTALTPDQIGLLRAWIDQGARWPSESVTAARDSQMSITPLVGWIGATGNTSKFREDWSRQEGFVIGYENFELREPVGKDAEFVATGRAIFDQNDYKVAMTLTKPEVGFVNGGYSTYRKYFNDTGGYYAFNPPPLAPNQPPFSLNQDLYVDNQKAWFNVGMTLPNLPKVVVGYEYLSRSGQESTLHWGQYYPPDLSPFSAKGIWPAYRDTAESTQIIKLDVSYGVGGFLLEDNFRGEFYRMNQGTGPQTNYYIFPDDVSRQMRESYNHFQVANAFRVEKQLRSWLFVSGGYLYTHLNGDASFDRIFGSVFEPNVEGFDASQGITLEQHSHTINGNALLGPWQGFVLSAGIQADWQQRQGAGELFTVDPLRDRALTNQPSSNLEKTAIHEDVALRYTRIPFTVLYAEAGFAQETYDLYQNGFDEFFSGAFRDSDSSVNLQDYQAGFTISPWQAASLDASYEYRDKRNSYNNYSADTNFYSFYKPGGYPGFLNWLDITSNEVEARLTLRPLSWLKTTLKYQYVHTEYRNDVNSNLASDPFNPVMGGELLAGNSEANIYSLNLTLTPWRRLYLSTSFSYSDSETISGINNFTNIAPYQGSIYSVIVSANYALNKSTDLTATYSFSKANYQQDDNDGLPLGIVYDRNAVLVGIKRRLSRYATGQLQYAFYTYSEPTSAGANNYRGNAIMASMNLAFR